MEYLAYPKMIYRNGEYKIVKSEEEWNDAFLEGWGEQPDHANASALPVNGEPLKRRPGRPRKVEV